MVPSGAGHGRKKGHAVLAAMSPECEEYISQAIIDLPFDD